MATNDASDKREVVSVRDPARVEIDRALIERGVRLQKALELAREPLVLWRARVAEARGPARFTELVRIGRELGVTEMTSARMGTAASDIRRLAPPEMTDDEVADVIVASLPTRLTEWVRWMQKETEYALMCSVWSANAEVLRFLRARFRGFAVRPVDFNNTKMYTAFVWRRGKPAAAKKREPSAKRPRETPL